MGVTIQALLQQEMWALQMLDAYGKPGSDFLTGQMSWLGSYEECINIKAVTYSNFTIKSDPAEQFHGKYCRATIPIGGAAGEAAEAFGGLYAVIGTCVPSSCSSSDITVVLETVQRAVLNGSVAISPTMVCVEEKALDTDAILVICLLAVLSAFVVFGTLYDVIAVQMSSDGEESKKTTEASDKASSHISNYIPAAISHNYKTHLNPYDPVGLVSDVSKGFTNGGYNVSEIEDINVIDTEKASEKEEAKHEDVKVIMDNKLNKETATHKPAQPQRGVLEQILLSFSVYSNGIKILNTEQGSGSLGAVNGIRFLSMCWVILGHTYVFAIGLEANLLQHFVSKSSEWTFSAITYATVSVDSFFAISGVLVAYLSLKELKKVGGALKLNWFMFYFHRVWRLTPPYMLVLMVGTVILPYVYSGPMWTDGEFPTMQFCRENWWTNLLYINNYVETEKMCMGWSWYLANDMQFYILSPLIFLPLFYNLIAGGVSCMVFLTATIVTTALVNNYHEYAAQNSSPYAPAAKDVYYMKNIYFPSYARMGPYVVGLFTGYVLYRSKCKCRIPKIANLICWFICISMCLVIVYGLYTDGDSHIMSKDESNAFAALHRTGWSISVCWIVFACATGHGGWINQILSWKAFIPLGRLTYCAYLVHPLIMVLFYSGRRQATYFTDYDAIYLFIGQLVMSYGVAAIVSLFFESPMMGIEKALFTNKKE